MPATRTAARNNSRRTRTNSSQHAGKSDQSVNSPKFSPEQFAAHEVQLITELTNSANGRQHAVPEDLKRAFDAAWKCGFVVHRFRELADAENDFFESESMRRWFAEDLKLCFTPDKVREYLIEDNLRLLDSAIYNGRKFIPAVQGRLIGCLPYRPEVGATPATSCHIAALLVAENLHKRIRARIIALNRACGRDSALEESSLNARTRFALLVGACIGMWPIIRNLIQGFDVDLVRLNTDLEIEMTLSARSEFPFHRVIQPTRRGRPTPLFNEDFRSCSWPGLGEVQFSKTQARVIEKLRQAQAAGTPTVSGKHLLAVAGSDGGRLRDLFKSHGRIHKAWGTIIVPATGMKGGFQLADPRRHSRHAVNPRHTAPGTGRRHTKRT